MPKSIPEMIFSFDPSLPDGGQAAFISVSARDLNLKESWFRESISNNPELIILPCEKADLTDEQWYYWQTEFPVKTPKGRIVGKIDVLLISESGRIGIVETKLAYNPERRRNVLAQILDYSVHLTEMSPKLLPDLPKDEKGDHIIGYDEMAQHLADGDFLLIVTGDELDERAVRLSETLLGDHQINPWDLALIDLSLYQTEEPNDKKGYLIVPTLRQSYISTPRHVVRVIVEGKSPKTKVEIERFSEISAQNRKQRSGRQSWNIDKFFARLKDEDSTERWKKFGEQLYLLSDKFPSIQISFGTGKKGSITLKRNGNGIIEFYTRDIIRFRPKRFKLALGAEFGQHYKDELKKLFPEQFSNLNYPYVRELQVLPNIDAILDLISDVVSKADAKDSNLS
jgi:hypothetical protein